MSNEKDLAVQLFQLEAELAFERGLNINARTIQLVGEIDERSFTDVDAQLTLLEAQGRKAVTMKINSNGGSVYDALAIVGRMGRSSCQINTEGYGCIMSAAGLILASGKKRSIHRLATFMHHEGGYGVEGTHSQIANMVRQAEKEHQLWCETMATLTNGDLSYWLEYGRNGIDLFLSANDCLEQNIVDEVF